MLSIFALINFQASCSLCLSDLKESQKVCSLLAFTVNEAGSTSTAHRCSRKKGKQLLISIADHLPHIIPHIVQCNQGILCLCGVYVCAMSYPHISPQYLSLYLGACLFSRLPRSCAVVAVGCRLMADIGLALLLLFERGQQVA